MIRIEGVLLPPFDNSERDLFTITIWTSDDRRSHMWRATTADGNVDERGRIDKLYSGHQNAFHILATVSCVLASRLKTPNYIKRGGTPRGEEA